MFNFSTLIWWTINYYTWSPPLEFQWFIKPLIYHMFVLRPYQILCFKIVLHEVESIMQNHPLLSL